MAGSRWSESIRLNEKASHTPPVQTLVEPRFGLALVAAVGALAAYGVGASDVGNVRSTLVDHKIIGASLAFAFISLGTFAVRRFANQLGHLVAIRGGRGAAAAARLVATLAGLILVLFLTLGMLRVPMSQMLLGGAITGVVLGIAAQQSLGNVFAGIVLLVARPFVVGNRIRIHSGAIGGPFEGEVLSIGLTYVIVEYDSGELRVPNLQMLGSAVMRLPTHETGARRTLYVNKTLPKRPPRTGQLLSPRQAPRRERQVRRPREMIRRMRERTSPPGRADQSSSPDDREDEGAPGDQHGRRRPHG